MRLPQISADEAYAMVDAGARVIDIRTAAEHAREHIPGAVSLPLEKISDLTHDGRPVVFFCRSGMRTTTCAEQLAAAVEGTPAFILKGGIDAWRKAGHATVIDHSQPIDIMRQVQIVAGTLVLTGVLLGLFVTPAFFGLSAFVGAGLVFAGLSGWCGMAKLLQIMPWNRTPLPFRT